MKAVVVLFCEGRQDNGFVFCNGVKNIILDLEDIRAHNGYMDILDYLNNVVKLFDGPCFSLNVITNTIYKLYELGFIDETRYNYITHFYNMHKRCC